MDPFKAAADWIEARERYLIPLALVLLGGWLAFQYGREVIRRR